MHRLLMCLLLALSLPVSAEIYRYIDANGNTVFTNQPPTDVESRAVILPPANTVQSPPADAYPIGNDESSESGSAYQQLELTGMPDDEAIRANNGSFSVQVAIAPQLAPGHRLRLLLDGQPYGEAGTSTRFQLINIERGEHSLAVEVQGAGGAALQQSEAVTFVVQRVNVNNSPALRPKPAAPPVAPKAP